MSLSRHKLRKGFNWEENSSTKKVAKENNQFPKKNDKICMHAIYMIIVCKFNGDQQHIKFKNAFPEFN